MVDTTDYAYEFINASEIKEGDKCVILDGGTYEEYEFGKSLVFKVDYAGKQRKLSLNKTNTRTLSDAWGRETSKWNGKVVALESIEIRAFGKKTLSIVVEPVEA